MQAIQSSALEAFFIFLCERGSGNPRTLERARSRARSSRPCGRRASDRPRDRVATGRLRSGSISHIRFHRFPAGGKFAPVHAQRTRAAHFRAAVPPIGGIRPRVVRNPVERIENAHPFPIGDLEFLQLSGMPALMAAHAHASEIRPSASARLRAASASPSSSCPSRRASPRCERPDDSPRHLEIRIYARSPAGRRAVVRRGAGSEIRYPF